MEVYPPPKNSGIKQFVQHKDAITIFAKNYLLMKSIFSVTSKFITPIESHKAPITGDIFIVAKKEYTFRIFGIPIFKIERFI